MTNPAASPHKVYGHCFYADCDKNYKTTTRTGSKVTCPHCHRVQPGYNSVAISLGLRPDPNAKKEPRRRGPHKEAAAAQPDPPATPTTPRVKVTGLPAPGVPSAPASAPSSRPPAAPPPEPEPPRLGLLDRALGFGR